MKTDQDFYDVHFLVCTNARENGKPDCAGKGAKALLQELKAWAKTDTAVSALQGKKIRINSSGCLNRCANGIACVLYPKGEWIIDANAEDLDEIKLILSPSLR